MNDITIDKTGWKKYRFDEVCRQVNEATKDPAAEGLDHVIGLEHIEPNNLHITHWDTLEKETTFTRKFKKGQILFGRRRAYQRKVAYAEFDGICSGDILVFEAIEKVMLPELLPFLIQSDGFFQKALETSAGSLSPRTKFKELADYEFLLPPKPEQKCTAALLWAADEMIEKEKMELEKVFVIKNQFIEQTQIQSVQKSKDKYRLGDIVTLNYGKALKESDRIKGKYYVVGSSGISGTHTSFIVNAPGIVVGRKGAAGSVVWVDNNFWPIDTAYWVSMKRNDIDIKYIYILLQSLNLPLLSITTAIPGLNREDVYEQIVYIPSTKEQNRIIDEYRRIITSFKQLSMMVKQSQQLKQELINKIF